jgi:anti-anti-sigma factor
MDLRHDQQDWYDQGDALRVSTRTSGRANGGVAAGEGATVTVVVAGEVDIATVGQLRRHVQDVLSGRPERVVIDCGAVCFIGATGLGTLVALQHLAQRNGTTVLLAGTSPMLRHLLEITGLRELFTLTPQ